MSKNVYKVYRTQDGRVTMNKSNQEFRVQVIGNESFKRNSPHDIASFWGVEKDNILRYIGTSRSTARIMRERYENARVVALKPAMPREVERV